MNGCCGELLREKKRKMVGNQSTYYIGRLWRELCLMPMVGLDYSQSSEIQRL